MKRNAGLVIVLVIASLIGACKKENSKGTGAKTGTITLSFDHSVKSDPLVLGTTYTNNLGEDFTVDRFKYYVHNIRFVNNKNEIVELSEDYFLVDHEDAASRRIKLTVPADTFSLIIYTLGVDSARNVSGAQTGALDPALGMFWTWSSGYVMAKLEGHSPVSTAPAQAFSLHVGGFKVPYVTIREIRLPLQENIIVAKDTSITVKVNADINTWFSRVHALSIAANPACHSPGKLANDIADNYEGMFSIKDIY